VANQVPVLTHHRQRRVVGVAVHVHPQDPVRLRVDGRGKPLAPGEVGADLAVLQPEGHVVGQGGVGPPEQGVRLRVGGPDLGLDVAAVPQVDPEPEGVPLGFQAQVGVALLGGVPPGVEETLPPFLLLPPKALPSFSREVPPLQSLKELPPAEDHLSGVLARLPGGVQGGLGLLYGPVGVAGVEAEEGAEGAVLPLELFPILPFQEAVVGEAYGAGEAAHQVQDGLFVFLLEKGQAGVDAEVELRGFALGHPWVHFTPLLPLSLPFVKSCASG